MTRNIRPLLILILVLFTISHLFLIPKVDLTRPFVCALDLFKLKKIHPPDAPEGLPDPPRNVYGLELSPSLVLFSLVVAEPNVFGHSPTSTANLRCFSYCSSRPVSRFRGASDYAALLSDQRDPVSRTHRISRLLYCLWFSFLIDDLFSNVPQVRLPALPALLLTGQRIHTTPDCRRLLVDDWLLLRIKEAPDVAQHVVKASEPLLLSSTSHPSFLPFLEALINEKS